MLGKRLSKAISLIVASVLVASPSAFAAQKTLVPDANGNLAESGTAATNITVAAGDIIFFSSLTSRDTIIEVASKTGLTSADLCSVPTLPTGTMHPVIAQSPIPSGTNTNNELAGPYRAFPAGVYALSPGSDDCGYIETVNTSCTAASSEVANVEQNGNTYRLCKTLPSDPSCVRNKTLDSIWSNPGVQGVFIRLDWKEINPAYNTYDWSVLNRELAQAVRYGKSVMVGIRVGSNSIPSWVFDSGDGTNVATRVLLRDWGSSGDSLPNKHCGFEYVVGSPSDTTFKALFKKLIADMAANFRADQRRFSVLSGVKISGMGLSTLENRLPNRCNIAKANAMAGDTGMQGHLIDVAQTSNINSPVFSSAYASVRITDASKCICNPRALRDAGYTPSELYDFYEEVTKTVHDNFGYKQKIYMNISQGFPLISETGRYEGDHLSAYIYDVDATYDPNVLTPRVQVSAEQATGAVPGTDIPGPNDQTQQIFVDARTAIWIPGGNAMAAKGYGVENAALSVASFEINASSNCAQQRGIETNASSPNFGSAKFPIPTHANVDATTAGCPNFLAAKEGITYQKVTGFQTVNSLAGAIELDSALWNMTLNTNGVFFEAYESDLWQANVESAFGANALNPAPTVQTNANTPNASSATAKTLAEWNSLLLARAKQLSAADPLNTYLRNPYPDSYSVLTASAPGTFRYIFNARACEAYYGPNATPVRINKITFQ